MAYESSQDLRGNGRADFHEDRGIFVEKLEHRFANTSVGDSFHEKMAALIGASVRIHMDSLGGWVRGNVVDPEHDGYVTVEVNTSSQSLRKHVSLSSKDLEFDADSRSAGIMENDPGFFCTLWQWFEEQVQDPQERQAYARLEEEKKKEENKNKQMSALIEGGKGAAARAQDEDIVLVVGGTGAEKNTFIKYLAGTKTSNLPNGILLRPEEGPNIHVVQGLYVCDCPIVHCRTWASGLEYDPAHAFNIEAANALNVAQLCESARSVRCIAVVKYGSWQRESYQPMRRLLNFLTNFKSNHAFPGESGGKLTSVMLVVTHTPYQFSLADVKKSLKENEENWTEEEWFMLDSLLRSNRVLLCDVIGNVGAQDLLQRVRDVEKNTNDGESQFFADFIEKVQQFAVSKEKVAMESIQARDFRRAAKEYCHLREFAVVHIPVAKSIRDKAAYRIVGELRADMTKLLEIIKSKDNTFDDADAAVKIMKKAASAFQVELSESSGEVFDLQWIARQGAFAQRRRSDWNAGVSEFYRRKKLLEKR